MRRGLRDVGQPVEPARRGPRGARRARGGAGAGQGGARVGRRGDLHHRARARRWRSALGRAKAERRLVSAVEHDAVFRAAPDAEVLPVARTGAIDLDALAEALARPGRAVVALQSINSETGTVLHPARRHAGARAGARGGRAVPRRLLAIGGPGAAARCRHDRGLGAQARRAGRDRRAAGARLRDARAERRAGARLSHRHREPARRARLRRGARSGRDRDLADVAIPSATTSRTCSARKRRGAAARARNARTSSRSPHERLSAAVLLIKLDAMGFAISAGSACSSGTLKRSRALAAFGIDDDLADRTVRVSLGWNTTPRRARALLRGLARGGAGKRMIYLDYQATTPLAPEAREAMLPWLGGPGSDGFGNPHSAAPARARRRGGGRAGARAGRGAVPAGRQGRSSPAARPRRSTSRCAAASRAARAGRSRSARSSIRRCSTPRSTCPATPRSFRSTATAWSIRKCALPEGVGIVSVMQVNNEIGTIQPVADLLRARTGARRAVRVRRGAGGGQDADRRGRPDRDQRAQVPRPQGHRRAVGARRDRARAAHHRRRAGRRAALGHAQPGAVRGHGRGGAAGGRARWRRTPSMSPRCGTARASCSPAGQLNGSADAALATATSTSAATGSTSPG